ncbi:DUF3427 domain-containing protein [Exiguobacterium sp. SH3S2]|uniref:DUF3427 domain-containing protein n=1 Tax=unclassified Exiguobacterium TaxID=2644629 RepID=UPI00103D862D|nr:MULTISPECIES: DEAD/DEAH box helicase [unclassified Exiguobacterium]TCI47400.1 DUF3427 domain-containing protein [Exiguobacterium sp. SH3S3]TCI62547.1 DUF3427 domain-containing protein [Exiguobacterium sp. SH3S2]
MSHFTDQLKNSLEKGFLDKNHHHISPFKPELLVNEKSKRQDVLTSLTDELKVCRSFLFSVAFITESGLATLKSTLFDLHEKGIRGKIMTSTYQFFNQPKVFKELLKLQNVEVRIAEVEAFHSKGYIFQHNEYYSLIVGSSNLTSGALKTNYEWNVKLTSHENGEIVEHFLLQFEDMWNESIPLTAEWITAYERVYRPIFGDRVAEFPSRYDVNRIEDALRVEPNSMQLAALNGIEAVRAQGNQRGLVVSATGTGKTYLAAFDVRRYHPNRMLFVVHREQILQKAKADFQRVIGGKDEDFGILSGSSRATNAKYMFATIQTISKQETLNQFDPDTFDYILIDESHRAGANTYQRMIEYFTPRFLLGMTATPERSDGYDLFKLFDYNIAYEIRLQEALEEDMLCPFHYFGVTDLAVSGNQVEMDMFNQLVSLERVTRIVEKIDYYGFSGERLCGLMFCSSKREAKRLSEELNRRGFRTCALTGDDSQEKRRLEVANLEEGRLDYILTVDIFNEGIDIPSINQVVMLRQTESSIVFVQQLGRGLRKHDSKRYVTVIDFIANYKNNYLIPVALSDDHSQNKDSIRRKVIDRSYMSGTSTINFEAIAKERIYESINQARLTDLKVLKEAYQNLKNRLGRTPMLLDFIENHSMDPIVVGTKKGHYGELLNTVERDLPNLPHSHSQVLLMVTQELLSGKRVHEVLLLQALLHRKTVTKQEFMNLLLEQGVRCDEATLQSLENVLSLGFFKDADQLKYGGHPLITLENEAYQLSSHLQSLLTNEWFYRLFNDVLQSSLARSERYDQTKPLTRLEKYTRKDACRLLNWDKEEQSTIYGYKVKHQTCPIFVTYHKGEDVEASVNYGDTFINPEVFHWFTRSRRTTKSEEVIKIVNSKQRDIDVHLFVKKDDDEGGDFYYLGEVTPDLESVQDTTMLNQDGQELPVVTMNLLLQESVDQQIYDYLHEQTH